MEIVIIASILGAFISGALTHESDIVREINNKGRAKDTLWFFKIK